MATFRYRPYASWKRFHDAFSRTEDFIVVFCDTETTGLDSDDDQIIQFAAIKYIYRASEKRLEHVAQYETKIRNVKPLPDVITQITGFTDEILKTAPDEAEAFKEIYAFMSDMDTFIAYNTPFDYGFVSALYERNGKIFKPAHVCDVMAMAVDVITMYQLRGKTLRKVAEYLGLLSGDEEFHDAFTDITVTVKVHEKLITDYLATEPPNYNAGQVPKIRAYNEWTNPSRNMMHRIYFYTDVGTFFYEMNDRSFGYKDDDAFLYHPDEINWEVFVRTVLRYMRVSTLEDLTHYQFGG